MAGALGQGNGVPGGLWNTNSQGVASPQAGRPAMTGGLQPLAMLQAYRAGLPMNQLQSINPYTARPTQFLPTPVSNFDYAAQYRAANPAPVPVAPQIAAGYGGGGPGGGDGSAASASSDGGADGSASAGGGGGGGAK